MLMGLKPVLAAADGTPASCIVAGPITDKASAIDLCKRPDRGHPLPDPALCRRPAAAAQLHQTPRQLPPRPSPLAIDRRGAAYVPRRPSSALCARSSVVEHPTFNRMVPGSNPAGRTILPDQRLDCSRTRISVPMIASSTSDGISIRLSWPGPCGRRARVGPFLLRQVGAGHRPPAHADDGGLRARHSGAHGGSAAGGSADGGDRDRERQRSPAHREHRHCAWCFEGHGHGRHLLRHAEALAASLRLPELRLYTNKAFAWNVEFYGRHGYAVDREEPFMGGFTVYMSKPVVLDA